jgi:hypothetical protein
VVLEPFDQVPILEQPRFELQRTVAIAGEVPYPGAYTLLRMDERLSSLVERAGALLPRAYRRGARFSRAVDSASRVDIDLPRLLASPGDGRNIVLQRGDSLDVPEYNPSVLVHGPINSPSSVFYRDGKGLGYYFANAGGYARNADKGLVSLRYADGSARGEEQVPVLLVLAHAPPRQDGGGTREACRRTVQRDAVPGGSRANPGEHGRDHCGGDAVRPESANARTVRPGADIYRRRTPAPPRSAWGTLFLRRFPANRL